MAGFSRRDLFVAASLIGLISGAAGGVAACYAVVAVVPPVVTAAVGQAVDRVVPAVIAERPAGAAPHTLTPPPAPAKRASSQLAPHVR